MTLDLNGAVVVVLGASSGLGLATAKAAHDAGARVTIVARDGARVTAAAAELGPDVGWAALDAADADAMAVLFEGLGPVDHVASFTGEQPIGSLAESGHEVFGRALDARVWAARNACAAASPHMPEHGSFVFCSGVSSFRPRAKRAMGAVATAALESFTRAMAVELAPLRVNAVCPGSFDTPVLDRAFGAKKHEIMAQHTAKLPLGRIGQPEELAHAVLFLFTNTYTTGTVLHVDGGFGLV